MESLEIVANQMDTLLSTTLAIPCEIAHYIVVISALKKTWDAKKSRSQPMTTWAMTMLCCFGGTAVVNFLCGNPVLSSFTNNRSLLLASTIWWLTFYCPKALFSSVTEWMPVSVVLLVMKEIIRTRKIQKGIALSRPIYPSSFILCSILGMIGACGGGFIKTGALVLASPWDKETIKTFSFSTVTKTCLLFSVAYNLQIDGLLQTNFKIIALCQASFLSAIVLSAKFGMPFNPYAAIEKLICSIFVDYEALSGGEVEPKEKSKSKEKKATSNVVEKSTKDKKKE
uniref:Trimeric intracellular cation channel type B n=1 Tax=Phallusia mammillata TaxID=59560 RepID=A0A6F9DVU4_9ASCI|nr:trimeric intracellular cation channel type B [Phallusia mammillata]